MVSNDAPGNVCKKITLFCCTGGVKQLHINMKTQTVNVKTPWTLNLYKGCKNNDNFYMCAEKYGEYVKN